MESDLFPIPEHQERSRAFTDAVLALKPKLQDLGLILENVIQESGVLDDLMEGVADKDAMADMSEEERAAFEEFRATLDQRVDATDARMTAEGRDEVRVIINDPRKRDELLRQVRKTMIDPLARQFAGTRIDDSITDARSARSRIAEILNRAGVRGKSHEAEMVRRLAARYQFSG